MAAVGEMKVGKNDDDIGSFSDLRSALSITAPDPMGQSGGIASPQINAAACPSAKI